MGGCISRLDVEGFNSARRVLIHCPPTFLAGMCPRSSAQKASRFFFFFFSLTPWIGLLAARRTRRDWRRVGEFNSGIGRETKNPAKGRAVREPDSPIVQERGLNRPDCQH